MMFESRRLALVAPLLAGAVVCACASAGQQAPPPKPPDDGQAMQLVQAMDRLQRSSDRAEQDTARARSVLEAIGGATQMQSDGGAPEDGAAE